MRNRNWGLHSFRGVCLRALQQLSAWACCVLAAVVIMHVLNTFWLLQFYALSISWSKRDSEKSAKNVYGPHSQLGKSAEHVFDAYLFNRSWALAAGYALLSQRKSECLRLVCWSSDVTENSVTCLLTVSWSIWPGVERTRTFPIAP